MPVSGHFPFEIRQRLVEASRVPVAEKDPMARARRINAVMVWARANHPHLFRDSTVAE